MAEDILRIQITGDASGAAGAITEVSSQAKGLDADLKSVSISGENAGTAVAAGMEKANEGLLSSREQARLFSDELGIKVPRAMSSLIAQSELGATALKAMFSGVAILGFVSLAEQAGEKLGDWLSNLLIFTAAEKAFNEELISSNKSILEMNDEMAKLAVQTELVGKSGSAKTGILLGIKEDEVLAADAAVRTLQDNLYGLRDAGETNTAEFAKLSNELGVAQQKLKLLSAESGLLSATFDDEKAKEQTAAFQKAAKAAHDAAVATAADLNRTDQDWANYADMVQDSLDKANKELEAGTAKTDQLLLSMTGAVNENEIGFTLLKKASDDVNASLNAGTVVEANAINMIQQQAAASERAKQALLDQQQALDSLGGRMNAILNTNELMTKGWDSFGKTAVKNLEDVGASLVKHLAIALLTDDQQKLGAAKLAAANTYASVSAVPVVGWVMAPLAAASAYASAMAFDQGGIVPENGSNSDSFTALVRPREMILPAPVSDVVQDMAASASGRSGGGDIHIHALDSQSFEHALKRNSSALAAGIDHMYNRGHSSIRKNARGK